MAKLGTWVRTWGWLGTLVAASGAWAGALHVPSPDWRDQVIYFLVTDRFDDGDPANNDQGAGEFDPKRPSHYSGGDIAGIRRRLDYLQGLGVTAVWTTPWVRNQWWNPWAQYSGYHGYWASDFKQVDPHWGTLSDLQSLSRDLHGRGMYLVQDVVVNHVGDFFRYGKDWSITAPSRGYEANVGSRPTSAPQQWPFSLNDPRREADRQAKVYHFTPDITDYQDPIQEASYQMSGLDDLNTENPVVRRALRDSMGHWVQAAGVDAFRVDTAFYVPPDYFEDFLFSTDAEAPGIKPVAAATGRQGFYVFGEGFGIDHPGQTEKARKIEGYVRGPQGQSRMDGMLNFPLYGALGDVFARGRAPAVLGDRIEQVMAVHTNPHLMTNFIDNHDVDRFLQGGTEAGLRQALLAMLTLPGVPVVYYGTEQGLKVSRAAMFASGWGSGGRDHFDTSAPMYQWLAKAIKLRRDHQVFSRGTPTIVQAAQTGPGALAYTMSTPGQRALVLFNTKDSRVLVDGLRLGLPPGHRLVPSMSLTGEVVDAVTDQAGQLSLLLPPQEGLVFLLPPAEPEKPVPAVRSVGALTLDPCCVSRGGESAPVSGRAKAGATVRLVLDGDDARALVVRADARGRWQGLLDLGDLIDPNVPHRLVAWSQGQVSNPVTFKVPRVWRDVLRWDDPAGDDAGPLGRYVYPTDPSWGANRQADIRGVTVSRSGEALRLSIDMANITTVWNPPLGFDHMALTVFLGWPQERGGSPWMPQQASALPGGMQWQLRGRLHGWSHAWFSAEGASPTAEGLARTEGATLTVDQAAKRLVLTLGPTLLGRRPLSGMQIYLSTWDYDRGFRALAPAPGGHTFGGGAEGSPLIMDDTPVLTVP